MATIINAENLLLGRLASTVAKRALQGEEIAIVNAEKAILSGRKAEVLQKYQQKRARGSVEGGPFFPRRPDHIMKRAIRGMVPYKTGPGREAFGRIKTYVGVPEEFAGMDMEVIEEAHRKRLNKPRYVTLQTVSQNLGAKF
ncbi:MAG: 50S ribosomal protein L13 [Methanocalculus sp. MSAO_Arc1]|uniref:50S ribosomal protein L13 n=1 Tax=Methanocalculus TaxID=71151 RepID=UPI000FEE11EE|nr:MULTISPECIES: 50S ribosomal protein L13 [unclassified Methanocalculus]MCP1662243.1 large subunit ribosomal protein L13 [Methanocalculus sp. AMF5]RQD81697.1 MAG: 50S ribosomal protein L13 [Methanocalculus sp. MSAO_Arc1]